MYQINIKNRNYDNYELVNLNKNNNIINKINNNINLIGLIDGDIINIKDDNTYDIIYESDKRKNIVGIVKIMNKIKYGDNGDVLYIFDPFNKKLPKFLVKIGNTILKNNNSNILCKINYHNWNKQYPRGIVIEYYGNYKNYNNYEKALIDYRCSIKNIKIKYKDQLELLSIVKKNVYNNELTYYPNNKFDNNFILSIDPSGCKDIDDVISFEKINYKKYKIGIHITDIIYYLKNIENYEKLIENRICSLYTNNIKINMLPDFLAENICSLNSNFNKKVISLFITIDNSNVSNNKYIYEIGYNIINSNSQLSYEEADKKYKNHAIIDIVKDIAIYNNINYKYNYYFDFHNVIEILMIITNNWIGNYLIKNNIEIPLRVHNSNITINKEIYDKIEDKYYKNFIEIFNLDKAEYKLSKIPIKHETLGLDTYTHFTSPIRRYIDIYIHNELSKLLRNSFINIPKMDSIKINIINKYNINNKYLQYDLNKLYLSCIKGNIVEKCEAYIIKILDNCKLLIYLKEYKLVLKGIIADRINMHNINIIDDNIIYIKNNNHILIKCNELVKCNLVINNNEENLDNKILIYL